MIWNYLRHNRKEVFLYFICLGIFALVFFFSNVPLDAILYAGLLCVIISLPFAGFGFYRFRKQHVELQKLVVSIDAQIGRLPEPRHLIDADYTDIIKELHRQKREFESQAYASRQEMLDYFSLWTHQIKTPIAAMNLIWQAKGSRMTDQDKLLSMELFHIEEYVDMALNYVRLEDMSEDLLFEEVELDQLIRQSIKKYFQLFLMKKIRVDFRETDVRIVTDKKWLLVVLGQLLSNALKYTEEGGTISICMEDNCLAIEDTGIGIKAEDMPRIFQKGFTGYNGRQCSKSTGQGLYLCKVIIEKLSHNIRADSKEGQGTKLILEFSRETFQ